MIAARNEQTHIGKCLEGFQAQDYPKELIETIVADGRSSDATRAIAESYNTSGASPVIVVDNPPGYTPTGLNTAIRRSTGDIVIIYSAHAHPSRDLIRLSVQFLLARSDVAGVGGRVIQHGETFVSKAVAAARNTPVGGGLSPYRYASSEQSVSTIAYGAYRREVLEHVGLFDEELKRNQDNELNARIVKAGYQLWFTPSIESHYYVRTSVSRLVSQMYQYGYWKPFEYWKDPKDFRVTEIAPLCLILGMPFVIICELLVPGLRWPVRTLAGLYMLLLLFGAAWAGKRHEWRVVMLVPVVIFLIHVAVGCGEVIGFAAAWEGGRRS